MTLEKWIPEGIALARASGGFAKCTRRGVGAVLIAPGGSTIATGRNGAPPGFRECTDGGCPRGRKHEVLTAFGSTVIQPYSDYNTPGPGFCVSSHAEDNAILRAGTRAAGALLAITDRPCASCIKRAAGAQVGLIAWADQPGSISDFVSGTPAEMLYQLVAAS